MYHTISVAVEQNQCCPNVLLNSFYTTSEGSKVQTSLSDPVQLWPCKGDVCRVHVFGTLGAKLLSPGCTCTGFKRVWPDLPRFTKFSKGMIAVMAT